MKLNHKIGNTYDTLIIKISKPINNNTVNETDSIMQVNEDITPPHPNTHTLPIITSPRLINPA